MKKIAAIIKISLFSFFCLVITALIIFLPKKDFSESERRALKQIPELSGSAITSGKFMKDFDEFTMDQFPMRDKFRSIKSNFLNYVLQKKDNHNLYLKNGYLSKLEYPYNEAKLNKNLQTIKNVYSQYLKDSDCNIYYSIIPDKNYYLKPDLILDYDMIFEKITAELNFAGNIEISGLLELGDFYKTDQHWKQECLEKVADQLLCSMENSVSKNSPDSVLKTLENPFFGAYYGQAALKLAPDTIQYYTSPILENCIVTSYNSGGPKPSFMYDMKKAAGRDPYEMFLSGSDALLTIENPAAAEKKELIIFRDSFASSLTPLLVQAYSKITLVDLRYIQPVMLKQFMEFSNQDVLFLYSTLVLNGF